VKSCKTTEGLALNREALGKLFYIGGAEGDRTPDLMTASLISPISVSFRLFLSVLIH